MPDSIIQTINLSRDFKSLRAVDDVSIDIQTGELFGVVGPDGAGKTTLLRLLAGLLNITQGSGMVAGYDLTKSPESVKSKIGYMAQQFSMYSELSVIENLRFFAILYDVDSETMNKRLSSLLNFAGLNEFTNRRAANLSGGMQKKLALACTLIHQPPILLLDEPTTGVDPVSRREFWKILNELHLNGTTIIVSTPYMDEADRCSRVGFLYSGKLVVCAPPEDIRNQLEGEFIEITPLNWQEAFDLAVTLEGVYEVQTYGETLHILVDSFDKRCNQIEESFKRNGILYHGARLAPARMEQAFITLIRQFSESHNE
jgi:ABC-2 type transport system ATP-binding protein